MRTGTGVGLAISCSVEMDGGFSGLQRGKSGKLGAVVLCERERERFGWVNGDAYLRTLTSPPPISPFFDFSPPRLTDAPFLLASVSVLPWFSSTLPSYDSLLVQMGHHQEQRHGWNGLVLGGWRFFLIFFFGMVDREGRRKGGEGMNERWLCCDVAAVGCLPACLPALLLREV